MNFLKKIFGGNNTSSADRNALYLYVRPKRCDRIVEVRIDLNNDLSLRDEGDGYWIRKVAQAIRCPFPAEMTLYFDNNRRLVESRIENGELVDRESYLAWLAENEGTAS